MNRTKKKYNQYRRCSDQNSNPTLPWHLSILFSSESGFGKSRSSEDLFHQNLSVLASNPSHIRTVVDSVKIMLTLMDYFSPADRRTPRVTNVSCDGCVEHGGEQVETVL
jgi:hypothetical protein